MDRLSRVTPPTAKTALMTEVQPSTVSPLRNENMAVNNYAAAATVTMIPSDAINFSGFDEKPRMLLTVMRI